VTTADVIALTAAALLVFLLAGGAYIVSRKEPEFAGHPKGLYVLFFAEMWERFSYYGMRALLIFYLTQHWLFADDAASVIYGAYTALVYITPVLGGYIADRYLGQRKAVQFGAVLLTFGHFLMAFEGMQGVTDAAAKQADPAINIFWLALSFIIVGSGFLKANISVIVGQLYPRTDVRRDGAYTIFYMGINAGAAIGTIIAGYLGQTYGWAYGFGAAGFGMLLGLGVFIGFRPLLMGRGESSAPARLDSRVAGIKFEWLLYAIGVAAVGLIWVLIQYQDMVGYLLGGFGLLLVTYVIVYAVTKLPSEDRDRIFAAMFLIIGSILFWALFEQAGSSINLYTDRFVAIGGVPAAIFQSINPIYIILLAPLFAYLWTWLGRHNLEPSAPAKFGLALVQLGVRPAGHAGHRRTEVLGELDGVRADRAGGTVDQHRRAGSHRRLVAQEEQRRGPAEQHTGRVVVGHRRGRPRQPGRPHRDQLGVRPHPRPGHAADLISGREAADARAHGLDLTGEGATQNGPPRAADAEDRAREEGEPGGEPGAADARVARGHRRCPDPHQHLVGPWSGRRNLDDACDLGCAIPVHHCGPHAASLRL